MLLLVDLKIVIISYAAVLTILLLMQDFSDV